MKLCGVSNREAVFLFVDTQIVDSLFLEDINALLHTGEVPNLFRPEEFQEVWSLWPINVPWLLPAITRFVINFLQLWLDKGYQTPTSIWCNIFPIGSNRTYTWPSVWVHWQRHSSAINLLGRSCRSESLPSRNYVRMYPALVNCTTVIYFTEWPHEALIAVAFHFLSKSTFVAENNETVTIMMRGNICWPASCFANDLRFIGHWQISAPSFIFHRRTWPCVWKMNFDEKPSLPRRITFNSLAITAGSAARTRKVLTFHRVVCSKVKRPNFRSNTVVSKRASSKWPKRGRRWRRSPWN